MELNLELYLVYAVAFRGWPSRVLFRASKSLFILCVTKGMNAFLYIYLLLAMLIYFAN